MDMLIIPSSMSMIALDLQAGSNSPKVNWCECTRIEVAEKSCRKMFSYVCRPTSSFRNESVVEYIF